MQSIKQYLLDQYSTDQLQDIVNHGCSGGVNGLIYYTETTAFHDQFETEIWDMLYEDAEDQGLTIMQLIASFNGQKNVGSMEQLKNLLCWYAVESVARKIIEGEM
jgi:hypothetical protein